MIRILLADPQRAMREKLKNSLAPEPDLAIVGTASDGYTALEQVKITKPNIVLLALEMPPLDGIETAQSIAQDFPNIKILIVGSPSQEAEIARALRSGALGYLPENLPAEDLKEALRIADKGYIQLEPGLFDTVAAITPAATVKNKSAVKLTQQKSLAIAVLSSSAVNSAPTLSPSRRRPWLYLGIGGLSNAVIWLGGLLYLQLRSPTYVSQWTVTLPGTRTATDVELPGIGRASSLSESPYGSDFSDPRENYKYLATTEPVVAAAAERLDLTPAEFGEPRIKIIDNTTLMQFSVTGDTPSEAQEKALAFQQALQTEVEALRQEETAQQDRRLERVLGEAEADLQTAQQSTSAFQARSGLNSSEQLRELSSTVEHLRQQQSLAAAELEETSAQLQQLLTDLGLSVEQAADAFALSSDPQFQRYLAEYSRASAELVNLQANLSASHPDVLARQAEQQAAESALRQQARSVLARSLTLAQLRPLVLNTADSSESSSQRASLFQQLISLQAERAGVRARTDSLARQIDRLESKLASLTQQEATLDGLERTEHIAEAVFSSTLTRLDLSQSTISASYPPMSLLTQPSLPQSPKVPATQLVFLGMIVGSGCVTLGTVGLWWRDRTTPVPYRPLPALPLERNSHFPVQSTTSRR